MLSAGFGSGGSFFSYTASSGLRVLVRRVGYLPHAVVARIELGNVLQGTGLYLVHSKGSVILVKTIKSV